MEAGERSGTIDRLFGELMLCELSDDEVEAGFRAVARVSSYIMLREREEDAHRLTQPQAAWGLGSVHLARKLALASALVWITSYRLISRKGPLDFTAQPEAAPPIGLREALESGPDLAARRFWHASDEERDQVHEVLATEAAVRASQHLVKYTRACFDLSGLDPPSRRLYLTAAAVKCSLAIAKMPRRTILDHLAGERG
jgi:hypothetical protein